MATRLWNSGYESAPSATDLRSEGDDRIRDTRLDVRERIAMYHIMQDTTAGAGNLDGTPVVSTADVWKVVDDNWASAVRALFSIYGQNHGSRADEIECGDGIAGTDPITFTADTLKGKRYHTLAISLPGGNTGRVNGVAYQNCTGTQLILKEARMECFDAPSGGSLEVDVHKLANGYTDPNTVGTSIASAAPLMTITTGNYVASDVTSFADDTLDDGDAWFFEVDTHSNADNIVLYLKVEFRA